MPMMITIVLIVAVAAEPQRIETQHLDASKVTRVETTMNHLTVIELAEPVTLAAAGSSAFQPEGHGCSIDDFRSTPIQYLAAALFVHRTQAQPAGKVTFAGKGT